MVMGRGRGALVALFGALLALSCGDGPAMAPDAATSTDASARDGGPIRLPDAGGGDGDAGTVARLGPPYPIVLAHGFFGFEDFAGVDFVNYFFEVAERLADEGEPLVFTPAVDPFNDSTTRGLQLLAEVEAIVRETGAAKVNLVGHSQGGLDARVVASLRPDLVASVTTFATPHQGTPVADVALGLAENPDAAAIVDALVQIIGAGLWDTIDGDTSLAASMQQLSTPGLEAFNEMYPDGEGVLYFSLTGRSAYHDGGADCESDDPPAFVAEFSRDRDAIEPLLYATQAMLAGSVVDPVPNDGLVRAGDAKWGTFLGCVPGDHFDEIGQLFGDLPGLTNGWRHDDFYVGLVAWLRDQGL